LTVGFGIAPNLLTLFPFGRSVRKKALAGLGQNRPYRRWGLSPRPENIGLAGMAKPAWKYDQPAAAGQALGYSRINMRPCRAGIAAGVRQRRFVSKKLTHETNANPIPVCSQFHRDNIHELWTITLSLVDGFGVQLR
jgi:hypothetical protein